MVAYVVLCWLLYTQYLKCIFPQWSASAKRPMFLCFYKEMEKKIYSHKPLLECDKGKSKLWTSCWGRNPSHITPTKLLSSPGLWSRLHDAHSMWMSRGDEAVTSFPDIKRKRKCCEKSGKTGDKPWVSPFPDHADCFNYNANQMVDRQIRQCVWNSPHESQIYFRMVVKILAKQDGVWTFNKMLPTTQFATSTVRPSHWLWQTPSSFFQVKHSRALQEQARTYLDLLCSMCDLSDSSVKNTAKDIQQTEQLVKTKELCDRSKLSVWLCSLLQIFFEGCQV